MVTFFQRLFSKNNAKATFEKSIRNVLGIKPRKTIFYRLALSHRSLKETTDENNERLEYLGDAILGAIIADYLFKRYPNQGEGFLTEMRSKMVNRQQLNEVALKMGIKKIALFNKYDGSLRNSNIFGNTLEALIGAVYLDHGFNKTKEWVLKQMIIPYMFVDDLELVDINLKNKLIGWAAKNGKTISFNVADEKTENGRRIFTIHILIDGELLSAGSGFSKKDASQSAAQLGAEKLGI